MEIAIVMGTTGEYSDRSEWVVGAFISLALAKEYAEKANQWLIDRNLSMNGTAPSKRVSPWELDEKNPYDPSFYCSYTGTDYYVLEGIKLMDSLEGIDHA